ncbi:MAG: hypothetical protein ACXWEY_09435, partial [Bacteroidia bacterium]
DCVWPGDANKDGIVNHLDILEIGVGFGANGLARTDTSTYWKAQQTTSWNRQTYYGIDYKHLDCDGNGKIDANDTLTVTRNYGKKRSSDFNQQELQNSNHYITFQFVDVSVLANPLAPNPTPISSTSK